MRVLDIMQLPETIDNNHESLYRSYHILQKVKEWLRKDAPSNVILELVADMEEAPEQSQEVAQ